MTEEDKINIKAVEGAINFQNSIVENFIKHTEGHNNSDSFSIFATGIFFSISNVLHMFGIKNPEYFLEDLKKTIEKNYMEFKKEDGCN